MSRARWKRLVAAAILLVGLVVGGLWLIDPILTRVLRHFSERLVSGMSGSSLSIESFQFQRAGLDLGSGLVFDGIRVQMQISGESGLRAERRVAVEIDRAIVLPAGRSPPAVSVRFEGLTAVASPVGEVSGERLAAAELLTSGRGRLILSGPIHPPVEWLRRSMGAFLRQAIRGELPDGSRLRGEVEFSVGRRWHSALLYTLVSKGSTRLILNRDDVALIGADYDQPLTEAEIDLVALYPLRAPVLLRIKQYASGESVRYSRSDPVTPRDAYRHVLWSYLLTREFGPGFARQVTDAHEIGATYETGEADREMDLANNAVGRRYAAEGLKESDLLTRMTSDPAVVRTASDS